jgi:adenylylsulfate kinase
MGLPGAGKTTLATELAARLDAAHFNADTVRQQYNDWDFTMQGRLRQAQRMRQLCDQALEHNRYAIADFICPTPAARHLFDPQFVIWVNTVDEGVYANTNSLFAPPDRLDYRVDRFHNVSDLVDILIPLIEQKQSKLLQVQ